MKIFTIIAVLILAAVAAIFFWPAPKQTNDFESAILDDESYAGAVQEIASQINELSPTPPTENTWTVRDVEFVKGEQYAYVVYHDTHNIFRILLETGEDNTYRTVATFEADSSGWRLTHGQDLATGRETVKISPN